MATISPYARLIRLSDDAVLAQSGNLYPGTGRQSVLDGPGQCAVVVGLGEAGDIPASGQGFAVALLSGAGGAGVPGAVVPLLLSLSLDGGTSYDTHRLVQAPKRDLGGLTLTEDGTDIWGLYGLTTAGGGHQTVAGVALADLLGKGPDSIIPQSTPVNYQGFISADHKLRGVAGLLYPDPSNTPASGVFYDTVGNPAWATNSLKRLRFTGVVGQDIAFALPVALLDTWEDSILHAIAVLVQHLAGYHLAGDTFPLGSRHYVADCSDAALNLSGKWAGVICDGAPTAGSLGTLSNAAPVARAVVIGSVGVASGLTFDGDTTAPLIDETTTALIGPGATLEPDLTALHGQAIFTGGNSDAGFPSGGTITAMTVLNRNAHDDAWSTCLPIAGINVSDKVGGVYYWDTAGSQLVALNKTQSAPVYDLVVDTSGNLLDIATDRGCLHRTTDLADTTAPWTQIGGLTARVARLALPMEGGVALLYALVQDPQQSQMNGVYVYAGGPQPGQGAGYNGWVKYGPNTVIDMVSTDNHSFFYLDKSDQTQVFHCDFAASPAVTTPIPLPGGVVAMRLDRVLSDTDTVWATVIDSNATAGHPQAAYYLTYNGTDWTTLGARAGQLSVGNSLKVNRFVGPFAAVNAGTSQVNPVRIFAATDDGLYYSTTATPTATTDWHSANDQNGLQGVAITNVYCGTRTQFLLGIETSRLFATTDTSLYVSHNSGAQWDEVTRGKVDVGAYVVAAAGGMLSNKVQTVGPMASSPIGAGSGTHVQVTTYQSLPFLPTGWYWQRTLTQRYQWRWRLVNPDCPFTNMLKADLSQFEANETQTVLTASALVAAATRVLLGQSSQPQMVLTLPSSFTQDDAALRTLQPTMTAHVTYHGTIAQKAADGSIVDTAYLDLDDDLYVLDHQWHLPQDGGSYVETQTRLSNVLRSQVLSPDDVATSLQEQLRSVRLYGTRRPRQ